MVDFDDVGACGGTADDDLLDVVPQVVALRRGRCRSRGVQDPGQVGGGPLVNAQVEIVHEHEIRGVECGGRRCPGGVGPDQRRRDDGIGRVHGDRHAVGGTVRQVALDDAVVAPIFRDHPGRRLGVQQAPAEFIVGAVRVAGLVGRVNGERLQRRSTHEVAGPVLVLVVFLEQEQRAGDVRRRHRRTERRGPVGVVGVG